MNANRLSGNPLFPGLLCIGVIVLVFSAIFFWGQVSAVAAAPEATYSVNSLADTNDGVCDASDCTLREAIAAANVNGDTAESIDFTVSGTIYLESALKILASNLTITAAPGTVTITKAPTAGDFNAIQIENAYNITLHGLTVTGMTGNTVYTGNGIYIYSNVDPFGAQNHIEYSTIANNERDGVFVRQGRATNFVTYSTLENNGRFGFYATGKLQYGSVIAMTLLQNNGYGAVGAYRSSIWVTGNDIVNHPIVFEQDSSGGAYTYIAYANNITNYATAYNLVTGTRYAFVGHNWWADGNAPGLTTEEWDQRLGAPVVEWLDGWGTVSLESGAQLYTSAAAGPAYPARNVAVIVNHGRNVYPFGNTTMGPAENMCSNYYDYFVVHASLSTAPADDWTVSLPVDDSPACNTEILDQEQIFRITDFNECTSATDPACWDLVGSEQVNINGQNLEVVGLLAAELQGVPFVAGSLLGSSSIPTNTPEPPTATATNTLEPPTATATNTPEPPTATATNTPEPPTATMTNTPEPPTATATNTPELPTVTPTNTPESPTATPTNTPDVPTATATNTPEPPTATATNTPEPPTATATNTPEPPTATPTNTPEPPTATPTNTPEPPTPTPTNTPTATPPTSAILYGTNNYGNYEVLALDVIQNTFQQVGSTAFGSQAIAQETATGFVYYFEAGTDGDEFGYWDPVTGANVTVRVYNPAPGFYAKRLDFAPDGTLYMMDSRDRMYILDTQTGDYVYQGYVSGLITGPYRGTGDMAFAPDGTLYIATYRNLYTVDVNTLRSTLLYTDMIPIEGQGTVVWTGLGYCNGFLYGSHAESATGLSAIFRIDPATGDETLLFYTNTVLNDLTSCPFTTASAPNNTTTGTAVTVTTP
ncbi:MAG: CSLREA domain-containing protein [Ardenticatenaceae bacterium]|nr:CSLREA domain-containing protein [Ardenticatenaceae bacterium]